MNNKALFAALFVMGTSAAADTSSIQTSGMGVLENEWVKAGVNTITGTLGSGNSTSPGLLFDPTGSGTFDPRYDYLTPGSPFDGFSVKVDGTNYFNNNAGNSANVAGDGDGLTDGENTLSWTGGVSGVFDITNSFTLAPNTPYIDITSTITMGVDATTLSFGKFIDPDSQGMPGDSSATDNVLGYGVIPETNVVFSEATVSRYALGIYTTDTNVTAGINGWSREADGYNGTSYTDADGNPVSYGNSDDTIGISWTWTGITAGDILTANYAYIFGPSAFEAADAAVSGGAGGGADVSSWGDLTDVGSATEAAESGGTPEPTVVSTDVTTITTVNEEVSSTLPVLTASLTHHESSVTNDVQIIARETTTTVTTPVEVTTTSFDRTTETYSDDSTVVTDGPSTSETIVRNDVVTTVTNPGAFVGRVDQVKVAAKEVDEVDFRTGFFGMSGDIRHIGFGKTLENGTTLAFGRSQVDNISKTGVSVEKNGAYLSIAKVQASYEYTRTIGDFQNSGSTTEDGYEISAAYEPKLEGLSPLLGGTLTDTTIDGWSETGSIQSALSFDAIDNRRYSGYFGAEFNKDEMSIGGKYHSTKEVEVIASYGKAEFSAKRDLDTKENVISFGIVTLF